MKYECKDCGSKCELITENKPEVCIKQRSRVYWKKVEEPAPKPLSSILPKLTAEVFDREDCPEWAKYAIVAPSGKAYYTSTIPSCDTNKKAWGIFDGDASAIPGKFNASDWQNSLIERPAKKKLPDFIKVGALVFNESQGRFASISAIGERIQLLDLTEQKGYMEDVDCLKPARVRPWTFEEAPLIFKCKHAQGDNDILELELAPDTEEGFAFYSQLRAESFSPKGISENRIQADGSPCGVLEVAEVGE